MASKKQQGVLLHTESARHDGPFVVPGDDRPEPVVPDITPHPAQPEPRAHRVAAQKRTVLRSLPRRSDGPTAPKAKRDPGRDEMLSDYLSSLGRIPLLTADEEKDLAARLRAHEVACWSALLSQREVIDLLGAHPLFVDASAAAKEAHARLTKTRGRKDAADVALLAEALRELDDDRCLVGEVLAASAHRPAAQSALGHRRDALSVRNKFVRANLRLVVSVARRFHHYRLPLIDLIQEGNLGLIKSVHRFDHRKGFRFSTYAHWWIRQAIERAIMNKGAQVRLPVHVFDARREVAKVLHDLQQVLKREASNEELAAALKMPPEKLDEILAAVPREPQSLDDPVGDDEDRTVGEVIADGERALPDEAVIAADDQRNVLRLLTRLSPMEVDILTRRFGLQRDEDETLEEIGKSYNLSRERVRQIQVASLKKIQRFCEDRALVAG